MKTTIKLAALAVVLAVSAGAAQAEETSPAEAAYKEIEAAYGLVPGFMQAYPKTAIAGAWAMTKGLHYGKENALEPKVKSLINLAVAAQIPCQYCIWLETKLAKKNGATDQEVAEAVAHAAFTRHWSAVLNGMQIDFETFKSEFGGD